VCGIDCISTVFLLDLSQFFSLTYSVAETVMSEVNEEHIGIVDAPDTNHTAQGERPPDPPPPPVATDDPNDDDTGTVGVPMTPTTERRLR
jgi:hypothetical protein